MAHGFKPGDRVRNGNALATVIGLVADDILRVIYDEDGWTAFELASYFRRAAPEQEPPA